MLWCIIKDCYTESVSCVCWDN